MVCHEPVTAPVVAQARLTETNSALIQGSSQRTLASPQRANPRDRVTARPLQAERL
jgi:hypothetical protein